MLFLISGGINHMERFGYLESKEVFKYFSEISQIPRESKHEEKISAYLKEFAKERNLEVIQDEANNIIIKKEGTGLLKEAPIVILQAHMDMVCEKSLTSKHNFATDPIEWLVKDDYLYANETTLGADNGIGVAYALALLASQAELPPLEVVLTSDEETGMTGAKNLDLSQLKGKIFINLDTEEEGLFYLSCAGGNYTKLSLPIKYNEVEGLLVEINVCGLLGGHSGQEINKERANASKVLGRYLNCLAQEFINFNLVEIIGGTKTNVITREAKAKLVIANKDYEKIVTILNELNENLKVEYTPQDSDVHLEIEKHKEDSYQAMPLNDSLRVVYALVLLPYGAFYHSQYLDDLVQTSANLGIVQTSTDSVLLGLSLRSSMDSQKQALIEQCDVVAKVVGATIENSNFYPAWAYNQESRIKDLFSKEYQKLFKSDAKSMAIHAGLECGLFKEKLPDVDFISIGPDIQGAHTIEERVSISSTERTWQLLNAVLKAIKEY